MERKYLEMLEELRAREEELLSKKELSLLETIELIGVRASIKVIAEELGIPDTATTRYSILGDIHGLGLPKTAREEGEAIT